MLHWGITTLAVVHTDHVDCIGTPVQSATKALAWCSITSYLFACRLHREHHTDHLSNVQTSKGVMRRVHLQGGLLPDCKVNIDTQHLVPADAT